MIVGGKHGKSVHWVEAFGFSIVFHIGMVFFVTDFIRDLRLPDLRPDEPPGLVVTNLNLDAETLAAAAIAPEVSAAEATPEPPPEEVPPETAPVTEPETPPEPEPEPEVPPEPEPETPPELVPEVPETVAPETIVPEQVLPEPVTPEAVVAEAVAPVAPLSPLRPEAGGALAGDTLRPSAGVAPLAPAAAERLVAQAAIAPDRVAPLQTLPQSEPASAPANPPAPVVDTTGVSALVARIRGELGDTCLIAIPQAGEADVPTLRLVAASEGDIRNWADSVLAGVEPAPTQLSTLVDPRQCAALGYARENAAYPAFRLSITLTSDIIASGSNLAGQVNNVAGRYISLLLIDDNGVVQDLGSYLTFAGGAARFDVPLTRDGASRDTSQLLLALATSARPVTISAQNGQLADDFFASLRSEVGRSAPIVLVPFDVR